jgi:branched-chain amino acid transport system substrate-binding protein
MKSVWLIITILMLTTVLTISVPMDVSAAAENNDPIRIAFLGPLSGNSSQYGKAMKAAIELKFKEYNEAGGYRGLKLVLEPFDDKEDPKESVTCARKIVNDEGYIFTLGPHTSAAGFAVAPIFGKAKLGFYAIGASLMDLPKQNDYVMRQSPSTKDLIDSDARLSYQEYGERTAAYMNYKDDTGVMAARLFQRAFETLGGKLVAHEAFISGVLDFSPEVTKVIDAKPELINIFGTYSDAAKIIQQARNLGYQGRFAVGGSAYNQGFIDLAKDMAEGVTLIHINPNQPEAAELLAKYKKFSGNEMDGHAYLAYDAAWHLTQAIDAVGTDKEKVIAYMRNNKNAEGTFGVVEYVEGAPVNATRFPIVVNEGKFTTLRLKNITQEDLLQPLEYNY